MPLPLCARCKTLDLPELMMARSLPGLQTRYLGSLSTLDRQACHLCQFLRLCLQKSIQDTEMDLSSAKCDFLYGSNILDRSEIIRRACEPVIERNHQSAHFIAKLMRRYSALYRWHMYRHLNLGTRPWSGYFCFRIQRPVPPRIFSICTIAAFKLQNWRSLNLPGPLADLSRLQKWLEHDKQFHPPVPTYANDVQLTVIDCLTRCLVLLPQKEPYATLSYVWGTTTLDPSAVVEEDPQKLPAQVPQTIQDSIEVCCALSIKYLWVDRYCIPQDNPDEKGRQIHQMCQIYQGSYLTIVACTGANPEHGLPGISVKRHTYPFIRLDTLLYLQTVPSTFDITHGVWAKRAWTYQEALLSSRRVYFTREDMFFESSYTTESEFTTASPVLSPVKETWIHSPDAWLSHPTDIYTCIRDYTGRALSDPADALNAIAGIFAAFESRFNMQHLHGLPYIKGTPIAYLEEYKDVPVTFERSLSWWSHEPLVRREGFPTWSWASWTNGRSQNMHAIRSERSQPTELVDFNVEVELSSGELLTWKQYQQKCTSDGRLTISVSNYIHIDAYTSLVGSIHIVKRLQVTYDIEVELEQSSGKFNVACGAIQPSTSIMEDLKDCDSSLLLAVHMSPSRREKAHMLLVKNVGEHWERVLLLDASQATSHSKMTRRKIRLG
ncbi:hypothetical protein M3J07_013326 [Ascochyta lentis]